MSTRQNQPEYLYFSPIRLNLIGMAVAAAIAAIFGLAIVQVWPGIRILAQALRTTAVAVIQPARVDAPAESAVTLLQWRRVPNRRNAACWAWAAWLMH